MEQKKGKTSSPLSAGCDAGSCKKTGDSPQGEKEELNEDRNESLYKNPGRQTSISEKQMTADETFRDYIRFHSERHPDPPLRSLPASRLGLGFIRGSAPSFVRYNVSSKTKGEVVEKRGQVQDFSTEEKQKEQAFPNKLTQPEPLLDPAPSSAAFNWNVRSSCESSHEMSDVEYFLPDPGSAKRQGLLLDGLSVSEQGSTGILDFPSQTLLSISPSDAGSLYPEKSPAVGQGFTDITGERLQKDACGVQVQSESESGGDHCAVEETGPPVTVEHDSTENSLSVDSDLQQPSDSFLSLPLSRLIVPPVPLSPLSPYMSGMIKYHSSGADATPGIYRDHTREIEPPATAGPSTLQLSADDDLDYDDWETELNDCLLDYSLLTGIYTDDGGLRFNSSSSTFSIPICSQSTAPTVAGPSCPQGRLTVLQDSTVCTEGSEVQDVFELSSVQSERKSGGYSDVLVEMETSVPAVNYSVTNTLPTHSHLQTFSSDPGWTKRGSSCLSRSHSVSSLSQITSAEIKTFTRSNSSPDMMLKNSFEEFTPDIAADEDDETYRFQCSCPGLYQCSVTGLVFHMEGEGDVVYRIVPWNRRLLAQHHKQPAGPLFDIKCLQQSVCQLHLPHCEIRSTGGCDFLSVAHVNDEGIEFIGPHKITETHVVINITGFSGFGNVRNVRRDSPDPVRALVLLFYRPPADPDLESLLNVLLLPRNVVLRDVLHTRKKLVGDESYIETSPHCKLHPEQEYTLSTCPEDSVLVQPRKAEFDSDNYGNYFPSFQVKLKTIIINIELLLRDTNTSHIVWESEVCLSSTGVKRSCGLSARNLPLNKRLFDIRSSFIDRVSGPVLKSLLDKLFEKKVMTDSERESANDMQNRRDKARFVIDTVRRKGKAASSEMIECLYKIDRVLFKRLGLERNKPRKTKK